MANDQDFSKKDDYEDLASEIDPKEMTEGVKQKQGFSRPHTSIPKAWGSPYADSSGMAGPIVAKGGVLTSEEIAYWSQRRDEMIARGEDPGAAGKAHRARVQARKDYVKGMFGFGKNKSGSNNETKTADVA